MARKTAADKFDEAVELLKEAFSEAAEAAVQEFISNLQSKGLAAARVTTPVTSSKPARKKGMKKDGTKRRSSWDGLTEEQTQQRKNKMAAARGRDLPYPKLKDLFGSYGAPDGWEAPKKGSDKPSEEEGSKEPLRATLSKKTSKKTTK